MYGLDVEQFRTLVVKPALGVLGLYSEAAENLVLGTALHESHLIYLKQLPNGPALGPFQMEPLTHADIWDNFLIYHDDIARPLRRLATYFSSERADPGEMVFNLRYAAAMCRVQYYRAKDPLPNARDPLSLAKYWKQFYNTPLGKGTVEQALPHFYRATLTESAA